MAVGAHEAGGGFGKSAGANAGRGIAVVVLAVIVGALLMTKGLDSNDAVAPLGNGDTTTTTTQAEDSAVGVVTTVDGEDDSGTSETTVAESTGPRAPAEVLVLVLNGAGLNGVAGRGSDMLSGLGYATATPDNAKSPAKSVILYTEGFEVEAQAVAAAFGVPVETTVFAFDPNDSPIADTQGANVIVRVGNDGVINI